MDRCLLCLSSHPNILVSIQETKVGLTILEEVIKQHFWFEFDGSITYPTTVCSPCCAKVSNFHEYYEFVRTAHINYTNSTSTKVQIKAEGTSEEDGLPNLEPPLEHTTVNVGSVDKTEEDITSDNEEKYDYRNRTSSSASDGLPPQKLKKKRTKSKNKMLKGKRNSDAKNSIGTQSSKPKLKLKHHTKHILEDKKDKLLALFNMNCDQCPITFYSLEDARKHYRSAHNREGYLICCEKKYRYAFQIAQHLRYHENPEEFQCKICKKIFIDKKSISDHMESHVPIDERLFKCEYCTRSYSKRVALKKHLNASHPNGSLKPPKSFNCPTCNQKFSYKTSLRTHINNVHLNRNTKMCAVCAKVFTTVHAYEFHYKVMHTNEMKRVQCNTCGVWLKHCEGLRVHKMKTCSGEDIKAETCAQCGKISPNRKASLAHIRRVHNSDNIAYPCTICGKTFKRTTTLREHMAIHTGETLYTCAFCPKTFRSHANMYKHYKDTHPVENEQRKLANNGPQLDQVINGPQMDQVINGPQMEQANNGPQLDHLV